MSILTSQSGKLGQDARAGFDIHRHDTGTVTLRFNTVGADAFISTGVHLSVPDALKVAIALMHCAAATADQEPSP